MVQRKTASLRLYCFLLAGVHRPPSILQKNDNVPVQYLLRRYASYVKMGGRKLLPNHEERIPIKVPALYNALTVLKHNFDKSSVVSAHNWCVEVHFCVIGVVRYATNAVNSFNLEIVCKLEGCVSRDEGDSVNCISLLAIDLSCWISQFDSSGDVYKTIVVRALWVRSWPACCKVCPVTIGQVIWVTD